MIEEANEFLERLEKKENLPLFTSCCPSWVNYINKYQKDYINNLSKNKSPIKIQNEIIRKYFAQLNELNTDDIITVTIAPCVSKKAEITNSNDYVITTKELAMMIRELEINLNNIKETDFDTLLGDSSICGTSFGISGGVATAVVRTAYYFLNNEKSPLDLIEFNYGKEFEIIKCDLKKIKIKIAKVYGISNFLKYKKEMLECDLVEYMACSNGCISGGGQPLLQINKTDEINKIRYENLKNNNHNFLDSYENEEINKLYKIYLNVDKKDLLHIK